MVAATIDPSVLELNRISEVNLDLTNVFFQENLTNAEEDIVYQEIRKLKTRDVNSELLNLDKHWSQETEDAITPVLN